MLRPLSPVDHVIEARFVEKPTVAANERFLAAVAQPGELRELKKGPERAGQDAGVFEIPLIGPQIGRSGFLVEYFHRLDSPASPEFASRLSEKAARDEHEKENRQDKFRRPASRGRRLDGGLTGELRFQNAWRVRIHAS